MHFARLAQTSAKKFWTDLATVHLNAVQDIDDLELGQVAQPFLEKSPLMVGTTKAATAAAHLVDFVALVAAEGTLGIEYAESWLAERDQ